MPGVTYESAKHRGFRREPPLERRLAELARAQHGVANLTQLRELGLSARAVQNRAATGRIHRVHRGVYALGHGPLTQRGRWMAAALSFGGLRGVSHRSAGAVLDLGADRGPVDVVVHAHGVRARPGITAHASLTLETRDLTVVDGIPCTTVPRTLLDLAEVTPSDRELTRLVERAEELRVFDLAAVTHVLERASGRRGAGRLRAAVEAAAEPALTASELEERFLSLCRDAGLPRPEVNAWLALEDRHVKVDFLWRAKRLVVETDGYAYHRGLPAFERDHRRHGELELAGWRVRRFTWRQVTREPGWVAEAVRAALASHQ